MHNALQLFTAQNGMLSAKICSNGIFRHLHSLVDPAVESRFYKNIDFWGNILVFAGIGLGYHIATSTAAIPKATLIIVIDCYNELIEHCKKNVFVGLPNRTIWISASEADNALESALSFLKTTPPGRVQVIKHPASFDINKTFYEPILDRIFSCVKKSDDKRLPAPLPQTAPCCALILYGNFFLEEEIRSALSANSIDPILFPYNDISSPTYYENTLMRVIQEKRPSLIFSINMKGIDDAGTLQDIAKRFDLPIIVWFVDDPRRIVFRRFAATSAAPIPSLPANVPNSSRFTGPQSSIIAACWEREYIPWLKLSGFSEVFYLPLAADPSLFPDSSPASPEIPLGFVGTSMIDEYAGNIKKKFLWSESLLPLVEEASEILLKNPLYNVDVDIKDCAKKLSITLPFSDEKNISWLCAYIIHAASMKKRKRVIGGLIDEGVETFGDSLGWKRLFGYSITTHPDIDYRRCLCDIYRNIRININSTSCQMPTAVNQRIFDIPCCGSFVISDDQKDMRELFEINKEAVVYDNIDDLKEKIRFFKAHDTERTRIIAAAQQRILCEHTYAKRIKNLLQSIKELL
jgi:spore maturation protein CgeB